ncbi:efflux RND transporter periplasmic adaptor subunit [Leptospira bandrabouensis]|uniref:Efflux RND transporter periplasmic adaptor subunit n=1 Tax=Leptospira bandrabouensis TaxID=2484903 RepID=A0A6H3P290_9LEPT|nr:efflux RND transporter periplasmic adaptor subunit [Leptospira bandrabouensis]MCG6144405.1 efflux RND transporter periplasmic adaptor subunit [Leptospira bandrabouensis]MCG6160066.1 efflux RND transporter periplasmic adaptor subunit [Leptospira bandrabouensis]MCG6163999.1 efflux RND transporter periplasmic adaptor subunit [Leptospira bandrabouensis]TGN05581.1 efflux RND transporter periplasmic adaptor subunit [Leptospira bandrabouensis]TGN16681.1 efflux RND transporter periplasmic adaptor s
MKIKFVLIAVVFVILSFSLYFFGFGKSKPNTKVESSKVFRGDLIVTVRATGTAIPKNRLEIKPPIAGRVESILVNEGNHVARGKIIAWMSSTERAALLDAARAKGEEELKKWEDFYKPTPVISPLRGLVIASNISPGQTVTQQDILYVLSDNLMIQAKVDETDLSKIKIGQIANVTVDSYSDVSIQAKVTHIGYEAVTENNVTMYNVDLELKTIPEYLRSGMSITIDFIISEEKDVLLVANEFVKGNSGKGKVLKKIDGELVETSVNIGNSDEQNTAILSGLEENELVYRKKKIQEEKKSGSSGPFSSPKMPKR